MQKLIINNFKQISHAEIDVKDFLLLIGPQASGKSTIAKLLYFFKLIQQFFIDMFRVDEDMKTVTDVIMKFNVLIISKFQEYFSFTEIPDPSFKLKFVLSSDSGKSIEFRVDDNRISIGYSKAMHDGLTTSTEKLLSLKQQSKDVIAQDPNNEVKIEIDFFSRVVKESEVVFEDTRSGLYIPAGRNITVSFSEQFQMLFFGQLNNKERPHIGGNEEEIIRLFMLHSKRLVDFFSKDYRKGLDNSFGKLVLSISRKILKGEYKNDDGRESIQVGEDHFVSLANASSGQQECIRIIQDLIYIILGSKSNSIRFIEEPESHIYPETQKLLIELMVLVANHCNAQMVVTTHSPYVLSTFNNMLYYSKVLKSHPSRREDLERHFLSETLNTTNNEFMGIDVDSFEAYSLDTSRDEYCVSLKDDKTQLLGDNLFDEETEKLNEDFAFLYSLM